MPGVVTYLNLDKLISFLKSGFLYLQNWASRGLCEKQDNAHACTRTHTFTVFGTYIVFKIR